MAEEAEIRGLAREIVREWLPPPDIRRAGFCIEELERSVEGLIAAALRRDRLTRRTNQQQ